MPDNTTLNAATVPGGDIIRSELISGAKFQAVKIALGVVDSFDADVSSTNPMPVTISGMVSTNNSTTTLLGSNAVFTGTGDDISAYAAIVVFGFADQISAVGGLQLEFSTDNINWDQIDAYSIAISTPFYIQVPPKARYFRIIYTNGAVAQGAFRLQTIYKSSSELPVSQVGTQSTTAVTIQGNNSGTPIPVQQTTPTNLRAQVEYYPTVGQLASAKIDIAASGDNIIVAGVGGQTIKVYQIMFICASPVNVTPKDGATALTGVMEFLTNGGMVLDFNGEPWFLTSTANDFILNLSGNVQVSGRIYYIQS